MPEVRLEEAGNQARTLGCVISDLVAKDVQRNEGLVEAGLGEELGDADNGDEGGFVGEGERVFGRWVILFI